jgi:hypothetical protein
VAINPPTDIVFGVVAAADPAKARAAADKLARAGGDDAESFETTVSEVAQAGRQASGAPAPPPTPPPPLARTAPEQGETEAMRKLEAFFLQSFVEQMLPKNAAAVYGTGLAGDIWKSMLAEHVAAEIASSAKFGIAERLAGQHFSAGLKPGAAPASAAAAATEQTGSLGLPYLQDALHSDPGRPRVPRLPPGPAGGAEG